VLKRDGGAWGIDEAATQQRRSKTDG